MKKLTVRFNKQKSLDSFNALYRSLKKADTAIKSFVVYVQHSAASAKRFHEDMEALTKMEEGS